MMTFLSILFEWIERCTLGVEFHLNCLRVTKRTYWKWKTLDYVIFTSLHERMNMNRKYKKLIMK